MPAKKEPAVDSPIFDELSKPKSAEEYLKDADSADVTTFSEDSDPLSLVGELSDDGPIKESTNG